jgi:hypothetical protein
MQLFTEHYMLLFLLHNTIGAWWAGKRLSADGADERRLNEKEKTNLRNLRMKSLRNLRIQRIGRSLRLAGSPAGRSRSRSSGCSTVIPRENQSRSETGN